MVSTTSLRPSKFIESLPPSDESSSTNTPTCHSDDHFFSILNEMDEFESRQQQRDRGASQSSIESLPSSNTSSPTRSAARLVDRSHTVKEGNRRSINFTRSSLDRELEASSSSSSRRRSGSSSAGEGEGQSIEHAGDRLAKKFVGRLRALTGGKDKEREHKLYAAT
jgi:hypothetical protein